jgi:hypothetical protein
MPGDYDDSGQGNKTAHTDDRAIRVSRITYWGMKSVALAGQFSNLFVMDLQQLASL